MLPKIGQWQKFPRGVLMSSVKSGHSSLRMYMSEEFFH